MYMTSVYLKKEWCSTHDFQRVLQATLERQLNMMTSVKFWLCMYVGMGAQVYGCIGV